MRESWGSQFAFLMAAAGSAVGLGNVWKFPYEVSSAGGGAFLVAYLVIIFAIGIPLMLAEFAIGRAGQGSGITAFVNLGKKNWAVIGLVGVIAGFLILSFYNVVAGWALFYLKDSLTGSLFAPGIDYANVFTGQITADLSPIFYTAIITFASLGIIVMGVQKGIGLFSKVFMPLLIVLLVILMVLALRLDGAMAGVKTYLTPDFARLATAEVWSRAAAQAFFSISIGMAVLLTYASYLGKEISLRRAAITVSLVDTAVAFLAGFIVMPIVAALGIDPQAGPSLVFIAVPSLLATIPGGQIFSIMFFVMLLIAAITSIVSIMEGAIAILKDSFNLPRKVSIFILGGALTVTTTVASLSLHLWSGFTIGGMNMFDLFSFLAETVGLPFGALLVSIFFGYIMPARMKQEIDGDDPNMITTLVIWSTRTIAPAVCLFLLYTGISGVLS